MPTRCASCVLRLGTQTKYNPAVATTTERKETAGDRRHLVHAYRRIPPNRIERMNCAIIEQSEQPCPAWRLIPAAHCRTATKSGINQPRNMQVVPWPRTSDIKVAAAHPFQGSCCGCRPPSGSNWIHEIKHDGYRLMAQRDSVGIRLITRRGNDWSARFPLVVEAVNHLKVRSCLIDGEVVCCDEHGLARFDVLRRRRNEVDAFLYAFDLLELNGADLRHE